MKIIVQNINGMRSAHGKGLTDWLHKHNPDIFCMQEIRISSGQIPEAFLETNGLFAGKLSIYQKYRNH